MRLVSVLILETHNQTSRTVQTVNADKVRTDNASSRIKTTSNTLENMLFKVVYSIISLGRLQTFPKM